MGKVMKADEFVEKLKLAANTPSVYATGGYGGSANFYDIKKKYATRTPFNREDILNAPTDAFYFDCVCLIKGVLWGWNADKYLRYGGAVYATNGVPDISIKKITEQLETYTTRFSDIQPGEFLHIGTEHCGIYIGDGLAIESTPIWADGVQITAVANIGNKAGYNSRRWDGHGKLAWIDYPIAKPPVLEVDGVWGKCTSYYLQKMMGTETDGLISNQPSRNKKYLVNCDTGSWKFKLYPTKGSDVIRALQIQLGTTADGFCGINTIKILQQYLKASGWYNDKIDGYMGHNTVTAVQKWINNYFQNL